MSRWHIYRSFFPSPQLRTDSIRYRFDIDLTHGNYFYANSLIKATACMYLKSSMNEIFQELNDICINWIKFEARFE